MLTKQQLAKVEAIAPPPTDLCMHTLFKFQENTASDLMH